MATAQRFPLLAGAGRAFLDLAGLLGGLFRFSGRTAAVVARTGFPFRVVVQQLYEIGVKSLPLTGVASAAIGVVMALQTLTLLKKFGVTQYVAVGVGLGMTIVHSLMELHGGRVELENVSGGGLEVRLVFPPAGDRREAIAAASCQERS